MVDLYSLDIYSNAMLGVWLILLTVLVQAVVASIAHRRQSHYVPGIINSDLSHESFVFRSHRTLINSLENLILMVSTIIVAVLVGVDVEWVNLLVWIYAVARIAHMVLYYVIATEKNPSPRSYFYIIGLLSNLLLLVKLGLTLI